MLCLSTTTPIIASNVNGITPLNKKLFGFGQDVVTETIFIFPVKQKMYENCFPDNEHQNQRRMIPKKWKIHRINLMIALSMT